MRLYLVRHGQTAWNMNGRAQGHTDIPLDPTGLEQANRLAFAFVGVRVDRVLCSDLLRCTQTVEPLGLPFETRKELRERAFGEWEGLGFDKVAERVGAIALEKGISRQEVRPPGGESFHDVWNRLDPILTEIDREDGEILVATHGGTASLLLARLVRGNLDTSRSFRFANCGYCELERRPDRLYNLTRYNVSDHLASRPLAGSLDEVGR